jgi:hypothetical protein
MIKQLIQSAKEDISLAIPTTATDLFFSSQLGDISNLTPPSDISSSFSCSVFFQLIKDVAVDKKRLNVKILTNA